MFKDLVNSLVELEDGEYSEAKKVIKKRISLREGIRKGLEQRKELPSDSEYYAGLKKIRGRISYKNVFEDLGRDCRVSETRMMELIEENRGEGKRLVYGKRKDLEGQKHFDFDSFEYLTPDM
ncbi:MAG: hypothetical protein AABX77_00640 [Nanoarchaeota archaeon]|mgnify:FL=1